jgi:hypothetical protein
LSPTLCGQGRLGAVGLLRVSGLEQRRLTGIADQFEAKRSFCKYCSSLASISVPVLSHKKFKFAPQERAWIL